MDEMATAQVNLSAAAAAADGVQVLLAGWGSKEGGTFKTWRRRFFILRNRLPGEHLGDWLGTYGKQLAPGDAWAGDITIPHASERR